MRAYFLLSFGANLTDISSGNKSHKFQIHCSVFYRFTVHCFQKPPISFSSMKKPMNTPYIFNPYYIGPHPSKACAALAASGQQCCKDGQNDSANQAAAAPAAPDNPCPGKMIECMQGRKG
ncbi:hypothetical protein KR200_011826 [Drosophila serrata]|nr:hypothetical protein KR200_011826 [Drosophila serrata]